MGARSKSKQKARAHPGGRAGHARSVLDAAPETRRAVYAAIHVGVTAHRDRDAGSFETALDDLTTAPADLTDASLAEITGHVLGAIWQRGWQPADVVRTVEQSLTPPHGRWLIDQIAMQHSAYPVMKIHDRWSAQLAVLGAAVWWPGDTEHPGLWAARERLDRGSVLRTALEVLGEINYLPDLPLLITPPGQARSGSLRASPDARVADRRMLDKVRGLLAKAESTQYPAEAESYSAKAQELMARHTIDHALLAGQDDDPDKPVGVRIAIGNPYAAAKALLLQVVAEANRCRSVWTSEIGFTTLFGFPADVEVAEMMFTSLLVQGSAAMVREGSGKAAEVFKRDGARRGDGRRITEAPARTRDFRESFLQAYASRIGDRLRDVMERASADAAGEDARLLPVLLSRETAVEERVREVFPASSKGTIRIRDEHGWMSGLAAAERVALSPPR